MSTQIVKILVRRGTDLQRRAAEGVGVQFSLGELGYAYDTNRLYIGDGVTYGGVPVSMKNLGQVGSLFGTYANSGLSQAAYNKCLLSGAEVGDLIYDQSSRVLYALSAKSATPPLSSDFARYDFNVHVDTSIFKFDTQGNLTLQTASILPQYLSQACVGNGLVKYDVNAPITIAANGVQNSMLAAMGPNTVKANPSNSINNPGDIYCNTNQLIGRTMTSTVTAIDFSAVLAAANIQSSNGILAYSPTPASTIFTLSSTVFQVNEAGGLSLTLVPPTTVGSNLTVNGSVNATGSLTIGDVTCKRIITNNNPINTGTANIFCGDVTCGDISSTSINTNGGTATCGNLHVDGPILATGNITSNGDVIAFNTSDARLKDNITPLVASLEKLNNINGYTFTWSESAPIERRGGDIGLLAQEIQEVIPFAVVEKTNGYLGVDYNRVVPFLVSCVKELKAQIDELRSNSK